MRKAGENPERWLAAPRRCSWTAEKIAAGSTIFLSERNSGKRNVARVQTLPAPGWIIFAGYVSTLIPTSNDSTQIIFSENGFFFFPRRAIVQMYRKTDRAILFNIERGEREIATRWDMSHMKTYEIFPTLNLFYNS